MMPRLIIIFLMVQGLLSLVWAEDKSNASPLDREDSQFIESLTTFKNPFAPPALPVPPAPPKVEVPKPVVIPVKENVPKPKPKPKPVDISSLHLSLAGMVWGTAPLAIINNEVVGIGQVVNGAKVIAINQNGVEFFYQGVKILLTLDEGLKKLEPNKNFNKNNFHKKRKPSGRRP